MKTKLTGSVITLLACVLVVSVAVAQNPLPGGPWTTGIQVQNVGDDTAQIILTGYDANSTATYVDDTSGANTASGASVNYVTFPEEQSSFEGAGVVSSDQPIVAIVNVNNAGATGGYAAGQYQGTSGTAAGASLQFPLVKSDFYDKCTLFYVQNAGSAAAVINATFSNGSTWSSGSAVGAGDMVIIDPGAATPAVPGDAPYALTVTSAENLAGTVLEFNCTTDPAEALQATRGFTPSDGDTTLLMPIYKNDFYGRSNGAQVMNVSGGPADIYITYEHASLSGGSGTYQQWQLAVPDGASVTFYRNTIIAAAGGGATGSSGTPLADSTTGAGGKGSLAAATITSTGNTVAINNESYTTIPAGGRQTQTTYSAIPASQAGTKIGIPLTKENLYYKTTGIQIGNAGTGQVEVQVTYVMNAGAASCQGTYTLQDILIDEGSSVTLYRPSLTIPTGATWLGGTAIQEGCFGGATIEVIGSGSVVAVVQEPDLAGNQDTKNYEGFKIE